jgi:hypothetical protein
MKNEITQDSPSFRRTIKAGGTSYTWVGVKGSGDEAIADKEISERVKTSLEKGLEVYLEDGSLQRVEVAPIIDLRREGTEAYTWNDSENKVLHSRTLYTVHPDGSAKVEILRDSYRNCFRS